MKKFILGFVAGTTSVAIVFIAYTGYLLKVAEPGYRVTSSSTVFTKEQTFRTVSALTRLSEISNLFGLDKYTALFNGSAGVIAAEAGMSPVQTKYALLQAMSISMKYGMHANDFNPYFEASFSTALLLKDQNEVKDAKKIVTEALLVASQKAPNSYWIANLRRLDKLL